MLHTEAIRLIQADSALIERVQAILEHWCSKESKPHPLFEEWRRILRERDWGTALSTSDWGNQIRQASPVPSILHKEQRLDIIWECRSSKSNLTKEEWLQQLLEASHRLEQSDEEYRKFLATSIR